jgi:hypothetical protein
MEADTVAAGEAHALFNRSPIPPVERRDCLSAHRRDFLPIVVTPAVLGPGARP